MPTRFFCKKYCMGYLLLFFVFSFFPKKMHVCIARYHLWSFHYSIARHLLINGESKLYLIVKR